MNYKNLIIEREEELAYVKINRPQALNALNSQVLKELKSVFEELEASREVRVVIITGKGEKAFIAGADVGEMKDMTTEEARLFASLGHDVTGLIENLSKPVIAAINGYCLGGGNELALACDLRIASENASFGQPEVGLGIIPGFGGTQRLPELIGIARAKELLFTGEIIDAGEAEKIGLVNRVVAADSLLDEARELAGIIIEKAPLAIRWTKEAVNFGLNEGVEKGITFERNVFALCFSTEDQRKGMNAFLKKEEIKFEGK